jgi:GGDEF domain-containing protein
LRVLFGAQQLIRNRGQFLSRLAFECHRAHRDRRAIFSLVIISDGNHAADGQRIGEADNRLHETALVVRSVVRGEDVVATPEAGEVWVLVSGVGPQVRDAVLARLIRALSDSPVSVTCRLGASTFGTDGDESEALFAAAEERMTPVFRIAAAAS